MTGTFMPLQGRGLVYLDEDLAAAIARREQMAADGARVELLARLRTHVVRTELGDAILTRSLRDVAVSS